MEGTVRGCRPQSSGSDGGMPCTSNKASWHLMLLKTGSSARGLLSGACGPVGPCAGNKDWDGVDLAGGSCRDRGGGGWVGDCGGGWHGGDLVWGSTPGPDSSGSVWYGCSSRARHWLGPLGVSTLGPLGGDGDGLVGSCCRDLDCDGGSRVEGSTSGPDKGSGDGGGLAGSACRDRDRGSPTGADSNGRGRDGGGSARGGCGDRDRSTSVGDSTLGPNDSSGDWGCHPPVPDEGGKAFRRGTPVGGCGGDRG